MLDVGGYPGFWVVHPQPVARIDSVNTHEVAWDESAHPDHRITTLVGDGCALPMPDQTYDIGFSNSVIKHVSSWENQQRFAAEILRTSKAIWVQTPAYEFPLEPNYLTPFIHYPSHALQKKDPPPLLRLGPASETQPATGGRNGQYHPPPEAL